MSNEMIPKLEVRSRLIKQCLTLMFLLQDSDSSAPASANATPSGPANSWPGNGELDSWNYWWSYSGVSGPAYWGLLNPDWFLCDRGRRQSPVNIETRALVYDPRLEPLRIDNNLISGVLHNDGHSIVFNGSLAARAQSQLLLLQLQQLNQPADASNANANANSSSIDKEAASQLVQASGAAKVPPAGRSGRAEQRTDLLEPLLIVGDGTVQDPAHTGPLMKDLSQNIEMSIGQSDLLEERLAGRLIESSADQEAGQRDDLASAAAKQPGLNLIEEQMQTWPGGGSQGSVHFSGAGLAYSYRFETLHLRLGAEPAQSNSSEHRINGHSFGAELQLFAYNWQLYSSFHEAAARPHGLLAISVLVDLVPGQRQTPAPTKANEQLERLATRAAHSLRFRGQFARLDELDLGALLPADALDQLVSYEGSLSVPPCHESVTWLLLNKPLHMTSDSLDRLRSLSADEQSATPASGTLIAGNLRPVQALNNRLVRTNIRPKSGKPGEQETCLRMRTQYEYSAAR